MLRIKSIVALLISVILSTVYEVHAARGRKLKFCTTNDIPGQTGPTGQIVCFPTVAPPSSSTPVAYPVTRTSTKYIIIGGVLGGVALVSLISLLCWRNRGREIAQRDAEASAAQQAEEASKATVAYGAEAPPPPGYVKSQV